MANDSNRNSPRNLLCSFCGKEEARSNLVIAGYGRAFVCYPCIRVLGETIEIEPVEVSDKEDNTVSLPKKYMNEIKGQKGDLIYISDHRWYLGGLKSTHARLDKISNNNKVIVSKDVFDHAQFNLNQDLIIELEV